MIDEYQRRLAMATSQAGLETERKTVALALKRANAQENRITDAYINEAMELDRYKAEMDKLGQRRMALERAEQEIDQRKRQEQDSHTALEHLQVFCHRVAGGLDAMTFEERQRLLRLVVERITLKDGRVRIGTIIPTGGGDVRLRACHPKLVEG